MTLSSYLLLVGVMALCFSLAMDTTFTAPWPWWLIPAVLAVAIAAALLGRNRARRARLVRDAERREMEALRREMGLDEGEGR